VHGRGAPVPVTALHEPQPRVAVAAIVMHAGLVLLGERRVPRVWQFPGGQLRFGEDFFACAERETLEETGLVIRCLRLGPTTSTVDRDPPSHYATVFVVAESDSRAARCCEPDKCHRWQWFAWDALPAPLFAPSQPLRDMRFDPFRSPSESGE